MKDLNKKIMDWKELKYLCNQAVKQRGSVREETLTKFYERLKKYNVEYKDKFDLHNPPKPKEML